MDQNEQTYRVSAGKSLPGRRHAPLPGSAALPLCLLRGLLVISALFALFLPQPVCGETAPATPITNQASAAYGYSGRQFKNFSNIDTFLVSAQPAAPEITLYRYAGNDVPTLTTDLKVTSYASGSSSGSQVEIPAPANLGAPVPLRQESFFHAGQPIYLLVKDLRRNSSTETAQSITVEVTASTGDVEWLTLSETAPNSGIFAGYLPTAPAGGSSTPYDGTLSVQDSTEVVARYRDPAQGSDLVQAAALVDPLGRVFDSVTGQPVDGISITLTKEDGSAATVSGDDGESSYPNAVQTGSTVSDSKGRVYDFGPGAYRFPLIAPGKYRLSVQLPPGSNYRYPSGRSESELQKVAGAPYAISAASRGELFEVNPGPIVRIDIPLDPVATGLWLQKDAGRAKAAIGDFVPFSISLTNASAATTTGIVVTDRLPAGLRYEKGSLRIAGVAAADPQISADGRTLSFPVSDLVPAQLVKVGYVTRVVPGTPPGTISNEVSARGLNADSNVATASVKIVEELFASRSILMGSVTEGACGSEGAAVSGARVYLEDGSFVVTDKRGMFHFEGVQPGSHVAQLDLQSLPAGYRVVACGENSRFAGRNFSQFVDLQGGSMWRTDFRIERVPKAAPKPKPKPKPAPPPAPEPTPPPPAPVAPVVPEPPAPEPVVEEIVHSEVGLALRSVVQGDTVTYQVRLRGGPAVVSGQRLLLQLPSGVRFQPGSCDLNGSPLGDPMKEGDRLSLALPDASGEWEKILTFRGTLNRKVRAGGQLTSAELHFKTPAGDGLATPPAMNLLDLDRKEDRIALPEIVLHPKFPTFSAELVDEDKEKLDQLAASLSDLVIAQIAVTGHTDNVRISARGKGTYRDNKALSLARAGSIGKYLMEKLQLTADKLKLAGMGETDPAATNKTEKGRALNRRVELRVLAERRVETTLFKQVKDDSGMQKAGFTTVQRRQGSTRLSPMPSPAAAAPTAPATAGAATLGGALPAAATAGGAPGITFSRLVPTLLPPKGGGWEGGNPASPSLTLPLRGRGSFFAALAGAVAGIPPLAVSRVASDAAPLAGYLPAAVPATAPAQAAPSLHMTAPPQALQAAQAPQPAPALPAAAPVHAAAAQPVAQLTVPNHEPPASAGPEADVEPAGSLSGGAGAAGAGDFEAAETTGESEPGSEPESGSEEESATPESGSAATPGSAGDEEQVPHFDQAWLENSEPGRDWAWPPEVYFPPITSTHIAIKHHPTDKLTLSVNGEKVHPVLLEKVMKNPGGTMGLSYWRGVPLKYGDNKLVAEIRQASGQTALLERVVHVSTEPVKAELVPELSRLVADGKNPPVIALRLLDKDDSPARSGVAGKFSIAPPYEPFKKLADNLGNDPLEKDGVQYLVGKEGVALIRLQPTSRSGEVLVTLPLNERDQEFRVWLSPEQRDWILVGLGEGTIGYNTISGNMVPAGPDPAEESIYQDGRVAFFAKGSIQGKWLLTMALDTAKGKPAVGEGLFQTVDPESYYTLYGDASRQQHEAASTEKLFLKIERDRFYALFGDFNTGLTVTELSRYSRTLTGIKSEYQGKNLEFNLFGSSTGQIFVKDELRGDGTSILYRLSRRDIALNSEKVSIEVRDRNRSEIVLSRSTLARFADYTIDYESGTLFFKAPVASTDQEFNPVYIVVDYEIDNRGTDSLTMGGRVGAKLNDDRIKAGVSYIHEGQLNASGNLFGLDAMWQITPELKLRGESAFSGTDFAGARSNGSSYLAELEQRSADLNARLYFRQLGEGFGLGQQSASEQGTRKFGLESSYKLRERFSVGEQAYRQENLQTGAQSSVIEARGLYTAPQYGLSLGGRYASDLLEDGSRKNSQQLLAGANWLAMNNRLNLHIQHDQSLGSNSNASFPTRTALGADYKITPNLVLSGRQEFSSGDAGSTNSTNIGIKSTIWEGGTVNSGMQRNLDENGERLFALFGLKQIWKISDKLSVDGGLDRSQTVKRSASDSVNPKAAPAVGGVEDFTAVSLGANYQEKLWSASSRVETRMGEAEDKWGIIGSLVGELAPGWGGSSRLQILDSRASAGERKTRAELRLGLAYRPVARRWILLDRLDLITEQERGGAVAVERDSRRIVNNLNANYNPDPKLQISLQYGAKYALESVEGVDYSGYTDLIGFEGRYDLTKMWDVGMRWSIMHAWGANQYAYSGGPSVGWNMVENAWVSLGYNVIGFSEKDFSASEYTAQGPYVRFRFKFDQNSVKDALLWMNR